MLLHEGAVFLTHTSALIVADVHLGKSAAFRARGLPVPEGDTARDLKRLLDLTQKYQAAHLIVAGDLFHARSGMTPELESEFAQFIKTLEIPLSLVVGNHDAKLKHLPAGLRAVSQLELEDGLRVIHDPADADEDAFHLAGHLHPVIKIPDGKRTSLRLACFIQRGQTLILPAFGSFTGGAILKPRELDRVFVPLREQVLELPASLLQS